MAAPAPTRPPTPADTLLPAVLLASTGGCLDAFLYLSHGHVFAGAMTGNVVLLGLAALSHNPHDALQHTVPLVAFFLGVWAAELLQERLRPHAVTVGLLCEALGLVACTFAHPNFPDLVFVPLLSFLAAYQVSSFRKVDGFSYNSTFITGNLRTLVVGLFEARHPDHRAHGLRQARELGLVIFGFLLGAIAGALLAPRCGNRTLYLPAAVLLAVLALSLRPARRTASRL